MLGQKVEADNNLYINLASFSISYEAEYNKLFH